MKKLFLIEISNKKKDILWNILMASLLIWGSIMSIVAENKVQQQVTVSASPTAKVVEIAKLEPLQAPIVKLPQMEREATEADVLAEPTTELATEETQVETEPETEIQLEETVLEPETEPETEIQLEEPVVELETNPETLETADINQDDLYWLAHLIYAENGSNSYRCQLLTGLVAVNRMNRPEYPDTIKDVVFDPGKYAVVDEGIIYNEPSEQAWEIARDILSGNTEKIPENVVYQAMFPQGAGVFEIIDGEYFCYK